VRRALTRSDHGDDRATARRFATADIVIFTQVEAVRCASAQLNQTAAAHGVAAERNQHRQRAISCMFGARLLTADNRLVDVPADVANIPVGVRMAVLRPPLFAPPWIQVAV